MPRFIYWLACQLRFGISALLATYLAPCLVLGQTPPPLIQQPQDNWFLESTFGNANASFASVTINPAGEIVAGNTQSGQYEVYSQTGAYLRSFSCGVSSAQLVTSLADGNYVCAIAAQVVLANSSGNLIRTMAQPGTNAGQVTGIGAIAQLANGEIVIQDSSRQRILIVNENGTFIREWGNATTVPPPYNAAVTIGNVLYMARPDRTGIAAYDENGNLLNTIELTYLSSSSAGIGVAGAKLFVPIIPSAFFGFYDTDIAAVDPISGTQVGLIGSEVPNSAASYGPSVNYIGSGSNTTLFGIGPDIQSGKNTGKIYKYRQGYRTASSLFNGAPPEPRVLSVTPRPGTQITDITYQIYDVDAATVTTAALAFLNGTRDLANAVRLATLTDGTGSNLGANIPTNVQETVSWNAGTDLGSIANFVSARISVLARDARRPAIIDVHFITIPQDVPTVGAPKLKISDTPIRQSDMLEAWFWLIATNDPSITYSPANGVRDLSNTLIASGTTTTSAGISFLLSRIGSGVRLTTQAERDRARSGSTGAPLPGNQYIPLKMLGPNPIAVNEIGFDTGASDTDGIWVAMP